MTIDSQVWCAFAKTHGISWSYHTVDEHPVGRVQFVQGMGPDVRATLVARYTLRLRALTTVGKQALRTLDETSKSVQSR